MITLLIIIIIVILAAAIIAILLYSNKAFPEALKIADQMDYVGRDYYFRGKSKVGFIIFSGVKTDERAYAYLANLLHEQGHTVVIPRQPCYISAFGAKHGMEIMDANPDIKKWIMVGHSLGGMPAGRIAAARPESLIGVAFLATYASADLSKLDISAIRITAENDGVMNNGMMDRFNDNLPEKSTCIMIKGGNHQGFAAYNSTSGRDGKALITWQEQNEQAARLILEFFEDQIREVE